MEEDTGVELDALIFEKITTLADDGNRQLKEGRAEEAIRMFERAFELLPEPVERWDAAGWLLAAMGDAWFSQREFGKALRLFLDAMKCAGSAGNPFLHLRLGQIQHQLGYEVLAADELARAYMGGGREIFEREDELYFEIVRKALKEPEGGW